jgi:hypothetical protein
MINDSEKQRRHNERTLHQTASILHWIGHAASISTLILLVFYGSKAQYCEPQKVLHASQVPSKALWANHGRMYTNFYGVTAPADEYLGDTSHLT